MDTISPPSTAILFGKTRRAVLALLYCHPEESFYLREIVRISGCGLGAVQRELKLLEQAGILRRRVRGRSVWFQANRQCPVFEELKSLVLKTAGVADILRTALTPLAAKIQIALVYGSVARGEETAASDLDVLIIGEASFAEVVSALSPVQEALGREINPTVYPPDEFAAKMAGRNHFLTSLLKTKRIFLIGDERELAGLAAKRVVDRT
jgi:predicted nucleotidyltransferase